MESLHCALVVSGAQSSHYLSRILFFATFCLHLHLFDYSNDLLPFLVKGGLTEFQIRMCLVKFFHWLSKCSDRNRLAKKSWGFGQRWSWFASIKLRPWSFVRHFLVRINSLLIQIFLSGSPFFIDESLKEIFLWYKSKWLFAGILVRVQLNVLAGYMFSARFQHPLWVHIRIFKFCLFL